MPRRRLVAIILLIIALVLGGIYLYFRPQINSWIEETILKRQEPQTQVYCEGGQVYDNTRQGYQVCYPANWHYREFGYSQLMLGFDSSAIPEASEYAGMITVRTSYTSSAELLAQHLAELEDSSTAVASIDEVLGIKVMGTVPAAAVFFPQYVQVYNIVEKFGRTFVIGFLSHPDSYEQNILIYEDFVANFNFLDSTPIAPWSRDIFLDSPWTGDTAAGTVRVSGTAQGAFESTIVARLRDSAGTIIFEKSIIYDAPDAGEPGTFNTVFTFETEAESGSLEVFHTSAKDGAVVDLVIVPLLFK